MTQVIADAEFVAYTPWEGIPAVQPLALCIALTFSLVGSFLEANPQVTMVRHAPLLSPYALGIIALIWMTIHLVLRGTPIFAIVLVLVVHASGPSHDICN